MPRDITLDEAFHYAEPKTQSFDTQAGLVNKELQEAELNKKREETSTFSGEFGSAFVNEFAKNSWVIQTAINSQKRSLIEELAPPDSNFKNSDDLTKNYLQTHGLPMSDYGELRQSKSRMEMDIKSTWMKRRLEEEKKIDEAMTSTGRISAAVAGALVSPEMAGGVAVGMMYKSSSSIAKVAMWEGAFEASIAATRLATDDTYSMYDAAIDIPIGVFAASGVHGLLAGRRSAEEMQDIEDIIIEESKQSDTGWMKDMMESKATIEKSYMTSLYETKAIDESLVVKGEKRTETEVLPGKAGRVTVDGQVRASIKGEERVADVPEYTPATGRVHRSKEREAEVQLEKETINKNREEFFKRQELISGRPTYLEDSAKLDKDIEVTQTKFQETMSRFKKSIDAASDIINKNKAALEELITNGGTQRQIKIRENRIANAEAEIENLKAQKAEVEFNYNQTKGDQLQRRKELDTPIKPKTARETKLEQQVAKMSVNIENTARQLKDILKGSQVEIKDFLHEYKDAVEELAKQFPDSFTDIRNSFRSKIGNKDFNRNSFNQEGWFKKLSKKQKTALIAAGILAGSTLSADSGEDDGMSLGTSIILLAILGTGAYKFNWNQAYNKFKDANTRNAIKKLKESVETAYDHAAVANSNEGNLVKNTSRMIADSSSAGFLSTSAPFIKAGGDFKKFITDMVYNSEFGSGALELKQRWFSKAIGRYANAEKAAYKKWKIEQGVKGFFDSLFKENIAISKFREEVTDYIETGVTKSEAVKDLAKVSQSNLEDMVKVNKTYKTAGYDNINYDKNHIPRLWKTSQIHRLVRSVNDETKEEIRIALQTAMEDSGVKNAKELSSNFVTYWETGFSKKPTKKLEADFERLKSKGILSKDIELEGYIESMVGYSDFSSRAKHRIDFDILKFGENLKNIKVEVDGTSKNLELRDFVERDIKTIIDKAGNTMYGTAALSSRGYTSVKAAQMFIENNLKEDHILQKKAEQILKIVQGVPNEITSHTLHNITNSLKDVTIAAKLPLVAFSTGTELVHTIANGNIMKTIPTLVRSIAHNFGKDSMMMQQLSSEFTGFGFSTAKMDFSFHGFSDDMLHLDDADVTSKLRKGTMFMRDVVLLASGLPKITDIFQGANQVLNINKIGQFIHGNSKHGIPASRLKSLGFTEDLKNELPKELFQFNSKGQLKPFDMEKMSQKQKDKITELLFNMNQLQAPETTVGETPLGFHTNDVGKLISSLISYPTHQFNTHGLQDMRHMDRIALSHMIGGVVGTYAGLHARYALQDKEVDNETVMMYALMSSPQMLGASAVKSMADPAVFGLTSDLVYMVEK